METPQTEAQIHSHDWVGARREATARFYAPSVMAPVWDYFWCVVGDLSGKRVLEYGCGRGDTFARLLSLGATHVTGIDIAPSMIAEAQQRIAEMDAGSSLEVHVMDAHALSFANGSFDVVIGVSILHHLDLHVALPEIQRILAYTKGGYAVFIEPMGENPVINWYRQRTPQYRTPGEHPLERTDLRLLREYFGVETIFFGLISLLASIRGLSWLHKPMNYLDRLILRLPGIQLLAWTVVLKLTPWGKTPKASHFR